MEGTNGERPDLVSFHSQEEVDSLQSVIVTINEAVSTNTKNIFNIYNKYTKFILFSIGLD